MQSWREHYIEAERLLRMTNVDAYVQDAEQQKRLIAEAQVHATLATIGSRGEPQPLALQDAEMDVSKS